MDFFLPTLNWTSSSSTSSPSSFYSFNDSGGNLLYSLDGKSAQEESGSVISDDDKLFSSSCPFTPSDPSSSCTETIIESLIKYSIGSLLIFIIFMSISGNILVCIAIYTDRRLRKLGNLFLASLAVADLFLASLVMTFAVANDLLGYWPFGDTFCEIWIASDVMCCTSSIINLCAISLDRFIHIKDPLRYENWMTKKVIISSVTAIWSVSALVSFLPISLGWHRPDLVLLESLTTNRSSSINMSRLMKDQVYGFHPRNASSNQQQLIQADLAQMMVISVSGENDNSIEGEGSIDVEELAQCSMDLTPTYAVVSSAISFYIPCLIMIALYTRLYLYAKKHVQNIKSMSKPLNHLQAMAANDHESRSSGSIDHHHHHNQTVHKEKHSHVTEHKAAITLGIIMGVFLFCWVPFFIVNIIGAFCKSCIPELLFKVLTWLGYFNSAMNPVIYSIFNTEFREAFRKILTSYVRNECCSSRGNDNYGHNNRDINRRNVQTAAGKPANHSLDRGTVAGKNVGGKTGPRNGSSGGGQSVPVAKSPGGRSSSSRNVPNDDESKVRKPLLPFFKRGSSLNKQGHNVIGGDGHCSSKRTKESSPARSCSLDTFPSSVQASKNVTSPLLTYSHVDIHTIDEHGGKISAI